MRSMSLKRRSRFEGSASFQLAFYRLCKLEACATL